MGLKLVIFILSPFLCKGFISENLNQDGNVPGESDLLQMYVRGDVTKGVLTFRIFIGIPSFPWRFLEFSDLIIFPISLGVVYFSFVFELGSLKFLWRQWMGLLQFDEVLSFLMLLVILSATVKK